MVKPLLFESMFEVIELILRVLRKTKVHQILKSEQFFVSFSLKRLTKLSISRVGILSFVANVRPHHCFSDLINNALSDFLLKHILVRSLCQVF
ncbi:hypothetical protein [Porphyromonas levii]|uniref:hypothetical protein n=1 Tax=Porphyromonas levii TaxID=28114 RepID=UPI001BA6F5AE|nr:hypothetical protein [Porphyromonas levii]MBR8702954.1 hypothetical protein [Porphyromonas levii]